MPKYKLEAGAEISGAVNHEEFRIKPDANGVLDVKDAAIAAILDTAADDPNHPLEHVKSKG